MSATMTLPSSLRVRLTVFRWHIRLLRAVRGLALLVVVLGLLAAAALLVDFWLDLPALARQVLFSIWLAAGGACFVRCILAPLCRRIDAAALAAVVEEKYPDLGERLSSAVELAGDAPGDAPHRNGSPLLIALLLKEAAAQSERLDFRSAFPVRLAAVGAALAAMMVLLLAAPALMWPQQYGALSQRFFRPWDVPHLEAAPEIAATPQTPPIVPVELAADSPTITIRPPAYARSVKEEETYHGLVDLAALQYSEIRFDFRFTRPAAAAYLEFSGETEASASRQPLVLSDDRETASLTIPAMSECKYRVILEAEQSIRTELQGGTIHVTTDRPPTVRQFSGPKKTQGLLPYESIPFEIEAEDDIGVAGVDLEYRINDGEPVSQPLWGEKETAVSPVLVRPVLKLAEKANGGDSISYRFRIRDNLPKEYNGPHVLIFPPDRWMTLQMAQPGDALQEREILAQRDEIDRRLQAIRDALIQERRAVDKVELETLDEIALPPEQRDTIRQLQGDNRANQKALQEAAKLADAPRGEKPTRSSALQPVADLARDVADRELQKSQQALEQAPKETALPERVDRLKTSMDQLSSAVKRLDALRKMNRRLAQEQLDRAKMAMLAMRQMQLAEQAAELAAKYPVLDPKRGEMAEKLKRDQAQAVAELDRLAQRNEPLKRALQKAREDETQNLAKQARDLAQSQRELAKQEKEAEQKRNGERFGELARRQQELARQHEELAQQTRSAAPAARTEPLKPEESQRAAKALQQEKAGEAIRHQDQAVNDLDRMAQAFERAAKASADPKEEARQLRQAEKALKQRVQEETAKKDDKKPLAERLKPLEEEQNTIRQATEKLPIPPAHAEANKLKPKIGQRAEQAAEALRKKDMPQAQAHMEETKNLLQRLSDSLPDLEARRRKSLEELHRLHRQQEDIAREVGQIKKDDPSAARRLADAAKRQAETAEALSKVDAPKQEERRNRAKEALQKARADLREGKPEKAAASQREAKRQLEQLAQQLSSSPPVAGQSQPQQKPHGLPRKEQSEQARQLARRQRELRDAVRRAEKMARADRPSAPQQAQQRRLHQDAGELSRQFQRLAHEARHSGPMQPALQRATEHSRQAQQTMQQARDQAQRGEAAAEKQSQERAAQSLDRAARAVSQATRPRAANEDEVLACGSEELAAAEAAAKAGRLMADAQGHLNRGQAEQARSMMQQAAQSLTQAAQRMAAAAENAPDQQGAPGNPQRQPGKPGQGRQAGGLPDLSAFGVDKAAYTGKTWGELPGELRTKIVQDMKARYGDDYARMIKSYFEQIADTRKK